MLVVICWLAGAGLPGLIVGTCRRDSVLTISMAVVSVLFSGISSLDGGMSEAKESDPLDGMLAGGMIGQVSSCDSSFEITLSLLRESASLDSVAVSSDDKMDKLDGESVTLCGASAPLDAASVTLDGVAVTLDGVAVTLDGVAVTLDGVAVTLDGVAVTLDGVAVALDGVAVTLDNVAVAFDGVTVTLDGVAVTLDGVAFTLDGVAVTLDCVAVTLDGVTITFDDILVTLDTILVTVDEILNSQVEGLVALDGMFVSSLDAIAPVVVHVTLDKILVGADDEVPAASWATFLLPLSTSLDGMSVAEMDSSSRVSIGSSVCLSFPFSSSLISCDALPGPFCSSTADSFRSLEISSCELLVGPSTALGHSVES